MRSRWKRLEPRTLGFALSGLLLAASACADVIELNNGALQPDSAEAKALAAEDFTFSGKQLFLLQFPGPMRDSWMIKLQASGASILNAIPSNAYLIYADAPALAKVDALVHTGVASWLGNLPASAKLQTSESVNDLSSQSIVSIEVQLVRDPQANSRTKAYLAENGARILQSYDVLQFQNLMVEIPGVHLNDLVSRGDVVSIGISSKVVLADERQSMIIAGDLNIDNEPNNGNYLQKLAEWGFTQQQFNASGLVVDVADTSADRNPIGPDPGTLPVNANAGPVPARHFSFYESGDMSLPSRFVYKGVWALFEQYQGLSFEGHGQLDMGIVGGYVPDSFDIGNTQVHRDLQGFRYGMGVAPFVQMGNSVMITPNSFGANYPNMASGAYTSGARISTNSWLSGTGYNSVAQAYDALTRDARADVALDQPIFYLFAAGNGGPGLDTVRAPSSAKNILTVGASESVRSISESNGGLPGNLNGAGNCGVDDSNSNSANDLAYFSSHGATSDGRQKPEIVAPGTHITGMSMIAANISPLLPLNNLGQNDPQYAPVSLCGQTGSGQAGSALNYFPFVSGQRWYTLSSGTSHATPAAAGGAALIYQQFLNNPGYLAAHRTPIGNSAPSPALVKAYILNSARYLSGALANDTLPSMGQGMGAMNLSTAFDGVQRVIRDQVIGDTFTDSGQSRTFMLAVVDPTKPVRVSLVYTDAPGSTIGSAYVNDLNLTLTKGATQYLGNVFSGAFSIEGGQADPRNNHEHVFLPAGTPAGTVFAVRIDARAINGDGLPSNQDLTDQDFALVAYNLQPEDFYFASGFE